MFCAGQGENVPQQSQHSRLLNKIAQAKLESKNAAARLHIYLGEGAT
jgi:hypothetical protein